MAEKKWVLVPMLTGREKEPQFADKLKECGKVVFVFVADQSRLGAFTTTEAGAMIKKAEQDFGEMKQMLGEPVIVKTLIEWGSTVEKLEGLARIEQVDEIMLADSVQSRQIAAQLSSKGFKVALL